MIAQFRSDRREVNHRRAKYNHGVAGDTTDLGDKAIDEQAGFGWCAVHFPVADDVCFGCHNESSIPPKSLRYQKSHSVGGACLTSVRAEDPNYEVAFFQSAHLEKRAHDTG